MTELLMDQVRVLVVDDDAGVLKLFESYLAKLGCRARFALNGQEALEQVRQFNFDICFMDIMMPAMNGIEATTIIREEISRQLPIIAVTSSTMKATRETCLEVDMNDYVVKPVSLDIIRDMIRKHALHCPPAAQDGSRA